MSEISIDNSWLSDHPLVSVQVSNPVSPEVPPDSPYSYKIGVFNVLAESMSQFKTNSHKVTEDLNAKYQVLHKKLDELTQKNIKIPQDNKEKIHYTKDDYTREYNQIKSIKPLAKLKESDNVLQYIIAIYNELNPNPNPESILTSGNLEKITTLFKAKVNFSTAQADNKFHDSLIDSFFETARMGGFKIKVGAGLTLNQDSYIRAKKKFLIKQIKLFFSDNNTPVQPRFLVCPEFDYDDLIHEDGYLKEERDIKACKVGYYEEQTTAIDKKIFKPQLNFCRVVFHNQQKAPKIQRKTLGTIKKKYSVDFLKFEALQVCIVSVHLNSENYGNSIPESKQDEAKAFMELLKEKQKQGFFQGYKVYVAGDFNYPFYNEKEEEKKKTEFEDKFKDDTHKIVFHSDMTDGSYGATKKLREKNLYNAQAEKAGIERKYGTDFIGQYILHGTNQSNIHCNKTLPGDNIESYCPYFEPLSSFTLNNEGKLEPVTGEGNVLTLEQRIQALANQGLGTGGGKKKRNRTKKNKSKKYKRTKRRYKTTKKYKKFRNKNRTKK